MGPSGPVGSRREARWPIRTSPAKVTCHGAPITGLYSCGGDMASIMGGHYPGAGITLGPALTFGYRIGKAIASQGREGRS